jgi:hypothetical protein
MHDYSVKHTQCCPSTVGMGKGDLEMSYVYLPHRTLASRQLPHAILETILTPTVGLC